MTFFLGEREKWICVGAAIRRRSYITKGHHYMEVYHDDSRNQN